MHQHQYSKTRLHNIFTSISPQCDRCKMAEGTLAHIGFVLFCMIFGQTFLNCFQGLSKFIFNLTTIWLFLLELLTLLYSAIYESVLCSSVIFWIGSATKSDFRRLQWIVRTAEINLQNFIPPEGGKEQGKKSHWTSSLNCCFIVIFIFITLNYMHVCNAYDFCTQIFCHQDKFLVCINKVWQ